MWRSMTAHANQQCTYNDFDNDDFDNNDFDNNDDDDDDSHILDNDDEWGRIKIICLLLLLLSWIKLRNQG